MLFLLRFLFQVPEPIAEALPSQRLVAQEEPFIIREPQVVEHQQPHPLLHIQFLLPEPITSGRVHLLVAGARKEVQLLQSILFPLQFPFQVEERIAEALPSPQQVVPEEPYITREQQAMEPLLPIHLILKQFHLQVPIISGHAHQQVAGEQKEVPP